MQGPSPSDLLAELGIPADYGTRPQLPQYSETAMLQDAGPNIVGRLQRLTPATAHWWAEMCAAAAQDKVNLLLVSGFRSFEYQADLIRNKLRAGQTITEILRVNVAPGYSQHHTGRAIDIATPGFKPLLEEFEQSPAFTWLQSHAADFGFELSYPRGNRMGMIYEPWHWYRAEPD